MRALWVAVLGASVEIMNNPAGQSAAELNIVRQFLRDNDIDVKSVVSIRGHLSKLAQAALAAPFELAVPTGSLGTRHDEDSSE
jgi:hypothetical protein